MHKPLTKVFAKVGLDNVTSVMQTSAFVQADEQSRALINH